MKGDIQEDSLEEASILARYKESIQIWTCREKTKNCLEEESGV